MAAFLAMMRRLFLGAIIVSIMSICMKSQGVLSPILPWVLVCTVVLYLLFALFSWLHTNATLRKFSRQYDVEFPQKNFISVFLRRLLLDIISPIEVIVNLFKKKYSPVFMFFSTYGIITVYVILWFAAIR